MDFSLHNVLKGKVRNPKTFSEPQNVCKIADSFRKFRNPHTAKNHNKLKAPRTIECKWFGRFLKNVPIVFCYCLNLCYLRRNRKYFQNTQNVAKL